MAYGPSCNVIDIVIVVEGGVVDHLLVGLAVGDQVSPSLVGPMVGRLVGAVGAACPGVCGPDRSPS